MQKNASMVMMDSVAERRTGDKENEQDMDKALRPALPSVAPGQYLKQLVWQLSVDYPILLYCKTCYWGHSDKMYRYCPYTHGEMAPIAEFTAELLGDI